MFTTIGTRRNVMTEGPNLLDKVYRVTVKFYPNMNDCVKVVY